MNAVDIILILALAVAVGLALRRVIRQRRAGGCAGCGGDCAGCAARRGTSPHPTHKGGK